MSVKGSTIYASARCLWSLSRAGSLSCHTCYDTGLWVLWSHYPKDQVHVELPFTTSWYRGLCLTGIPMGSEIHMKTPDKYSQVILIWLHGFQIMGDSTRFITVSSLYNSFVKKINYRKFSHGSKAYLQIFKFNFKPHLPPASVKKNQCRKTQSSRTRLFKCRSKK